MRHSLVRPLLLLACSFLALAASVVTAEDQPAVERAAPQKKTLESGVRTTDDAYDFVYFNENRPILVRVHVLMDGKPLQAVWDDFLQHVYKSLDTDSDGTLSKEEAEKSWQPAMLFTAGFFQGLNSPAMPALDSNRDGKVSREELARYYRKNGGAPFQLRISQPQDVQMRNIYGMTATPPADALNEALFKQLDTNKDGKLTVDELTETPAALLKQDIDDDEMVRPEEILPNYGPPGGQRAMAPPRMATPGQASNAAFVLVSRSDPPAELTKQLQSRYGSKTKAAGKDKKLTRQHLGMDETTFKQLDADDNGELDIEELNRFAHREADLEFVVRLGQKEPAAPSLQLVTRNDNAGPLASSVRLSKDGGIVLDLGVTRLDLRDEKAGGNSGIAFDVRQVYKQQFAQSDRDSNGYVDENEAKQGGFFRGGFKALDRDGDGKVFEKELDAFLDQIKDLQTKAMASCASLKIADQGRGLFDLLDANNDSRLGLRELRTAPRLVGQLDRDGDKLLARNEVPRSFQLKLARGPANPDQFPRAIPAFGGGGTSLPTLSAGPVWFRKMDRNRDSDVSRREFLGTEEEFLRLDVDSDGLINVEEADRGDAAIRRQSPMR